MFITNLSRVMAFFSQSGIVSPHPPGKTIIGSVRAPTRSEMLFSILTSVVRLSPPFWAIVALSDERYSPSSY